MGRSHNTNQCFMDQAWLRNVILRRWIKGQRYAIKLYFFECEALCDYYQNIAIELISL